MPHLEENLRYSTTQETRCVAQQALFVGFPVLQHPALAGCKLDEEQHRDEVVSYVLVCNRGNQTTGRAVWELGEHRSTGTLEVKLGGKNMTFYQRVTAVRVGECEQHRVPGPR